MEELVGQDEGGGGAEQEEGAEGDELEEEGNGDVQDLTGVNIELVDGLNEGSKWLVVDGVHILHKMKEYTNETKWKCSAYYHFKCPFRLSTMEKDGEIILVKMADPMSHICSEDKVGVILHKFRLKLKARMQGNLDEQWSKIWGDERSKLLQSIKDDPELSSQVLLEMKNSRSFRVAAQRARSKMTPPIPQDHQSMDPEKVISTPFSLSAPLQFQLL